MTTILPCPFCGYDHVEINEDDEQQIAVCCPECLASGPVDAVPNGAINLWNVRAPERLRNIKAESHDLLSQALNDGDGVYRP